MTDDILKNLYDKYIKEWLKKHYKFLLVILLYFLYQTNFLISLISGFGFNILTLPKTTRLIFLVINDLIYVTTLIMLFKKEIINGIKSLKQNFEKNATLALYCWLVGCIIMATSSFIISIIMKESVSNNEQLVRESIKLAPFYMLFSCSIVAPIFEEMVFRNALNGLIKTKWLFIIVSGLSFGLLHVLGSYKSILDFLYVIPYGAMGSCFAYLLTKTKNISLPIIVHMLHNTILVLLQIIRG